MPTTKLYISFYVHFTLRILNLCQRLGDYNEEGFTLEDIKPVEELLDIQIKLVGAENCNTIIYPGEETTIYLYRNGNHFDVISSMKASLGSCYYCDKCDKPYNNKKRHRCRCSRKVVKLSVGGL